MAKRKAEDEVDSDLLKITPLGGGNEVGRSCIILEFKGKTVMLDCGVHPAYSLKDSLPFFDVYQNLAKVDIILVTHFHLDHSAALPYLLEKTVFRGRVFMTRATRAICRMMLTDFIKISNIGEDDQLYTERDLQRCMEKIEVIDYHQEIDVSGIKFKAYHAGHVLGAAMFMVEIAGVKVLYTGDYSLEEDRHLRGAEQPEQRPDVLIVESTYGVQKHDSRAHREKMFTQAIHKTVEKDGRVLIPVFAVGRAQELLLILDEYWGEHPELHQIPIYYASALAKKCMVVYQTYIDMMNERIRTQFAVSNPFVFKHISNLKSIDDFDDSVPSVVMASPGMLQSGLSRELFEMWCEDSRNAVVMAGYCVEGTLAKTIMQHPKTITKMNFKEVPLRMGVHYVSFSAHADFPQTSKFIEELQPPHIILVHGDAKEMGRLKQELIKQYEGKNVEVLSPRNCQSVVLRFKGAKMAKMVGGMAKRRPTHGINVSGLLVKKDFNHHIMSAEDLSTYTQLSVSSVQQELSIPFPHNFSLARHFLLQMYGKGGDADDLYSVHDGAVTVLSKPEKGSVCIQWMSDPLNDMLADAVIALLMSVDTSPAALKLSTHKHGRVDPRREAGALGEEMKVAQRMMAQRFGDKVTVDLDQKLLEVVVDDIVAVVNYADGSVACESQALAEQVAEAMKHVQEAIQPCAKAVDEVKDRTLQTTEALGTSTKPMEITEV